jgi:hypothetical protein
LLLFAARKNRPSNMAPHGQHLFVAKSTSMTSGVHPRSLIGNLVPETVRPQPVCSPNVVSGVLTRLILTCGGKTSPSFAAV